MIWSQLTAFAIAAFLLAILPGPDNLYVLTESLSRGWKRGVWITVGLISGVLVHTTLVASGASLVMFRYDWAYDLIKLLGAAYLLYLAYGAWREKPMNLETNQEQSPEGLAVIAKGFTMNVLNPKVTLFFMVLLPQFVGDHGWNPFAQMIVLGLVFMLVSFVVFSSIAWMAGRLTSLLQQPRFWQYTKAIKVLVLVALAITLALSKA